MTAMTVNQRLLHRMAPVGAQPLDRGDEAALGLGQGDEARAQRLSVDQDHAGAAVAGAAAVFRAGQVGRVAQRPQQRRLRVELEEDRPVVDGQLGHPGA